MGRLFILENQADKLTRVKKNWLCERVVSYAAASVVPPNNSMIRDIHEQHHLGIDRTLFLVRKKFPFTPRKLVADVIKGCARCCSIDPAPVRWQPGSLSVHENWTRLAADVTHFNNRCYLSLVDCGPSRFAIWRKLRDESADSVVPELLQIFRERGPPLEILMDNGASFRSSAVSVLLRSWGVKPTFRCAYRPEGNSIVERNHRTIKRMAARSNGEPEDMVFYYNVTPREGIADGTVPSDSLHRYQWSIPGIGPEQVRGNDADVRSQWNSGDKVFVKPRSARCTTPWTRGVVTGVQSAQRLEVNGIPRHVSDLRPVPIENADEKVKSQSCGEEDDDSAAVSSSRPRRTSRRPDFYGNNIYDT